MGQGKGASFQIAAVVQGNIHRDKPNSYKSGPGNERHSAGELQAADVRDEGREQGEIKENLG